MPFEEGVEIIITAQRANDEEKLFMRWVFSYQTMMTYEDFKKKLSSHKVEDDRNEEEILDSVKSILEISNGTEHI